ncbi:T9SS type A sorting domain-containing protein, partial [Caldithrix abyssi]
VPFEAWDVGRGTYDDATDDIRCLTGGYSGGATPGVFDFAYQDPAFGFPATDWIDIRKPINEQGSYPVFAQDIESGVFSYSWWDNSVEILSGIIICDYGGAATLPPTNTVIRFITTKGPDENLTFTFNAPGKIENDPELMKKDVEKINVFPNPYYAASSMEPDRFTHFVTFNHLPPHAIIRIFTLNGALVRKLEKLDDSQFFRWDLKNEKGWRVASGLYIVHIDMPELGKQKVLKLMVITGEEVLDYY